MSHSKFRQCDPIHPLKTPLPFLFFKFSPALLRTTTNEQIHLHYSNEIKLFHFAQIPHQKFPFHCHLKYCWLLQETEYQQIVPRDTDWQIYVCRCIDLWRHKTYQATYSQGKYHTLIPEQFLRYLVPTSKQPIPSWQLNCPRQWLYYKWGRMLLVMEHQLDCQITFQMTGPLPKQVSRQIQHHSELETSSLKIDRPPPRQKHVNSCPIFAWAIARQRQ